MASGDTVLMYDGNYGTFLAGRTAVEDYAGNAVDLFTDWVTFKAAPGQTPHVTNIDLGTLWYLNGSGVRVQLDIGNGQPKGNANAYLRFEGLTIDDGVSILGSRHVEINGCTIHRLGGLNGSVENIEKKMGINTFYGAFITIAGNEITHVAVGINAAGSSTVIKDNHIHHNSHDGIHVLGGPDWLIEGNRIHDLDDGADDGNGGPTDPAWDPEAGQSWNRHCDGIQVYDLNGDGSDAVVNLTVRRNLFYHLESMGMMIQCKTDGIPDAQLVPPGRFSNFVIENNVFGPVGGRVIILGVDLNGGFVLRHNTVLQAPNDSWTSLYRAMPAPTNSDAHNIQMWADTTIPSRSTIFQQYRVYNNIFGDADFGDSYGTYSSIYAFTAGNLVYGSGGVLANGNRWYTTLPYAPIPGNIQDWIDAGHLPGQLLAGSVAIDNGSNTYAAQVPTDFSGQVRDAHPDIGAFEYATAGTYAAWAAAAGLTGAQALATADPDGDGFCNLLEYALGGNPLLPSGAIAPSAEPSLSAVALTYRHNKSANVTFAYQTSTDLAAWTPVALTPSIVNADADGDGRVELLRVLLPGSGGDTRRFLRLAVTTVP